MLGQGFVMVFGALKSVVKLIDTHWTFVKLILTDDKIILVFHLAEEIKVHVALLKTLHEILVIEVINNAVE